jgi:hypothetical protein
MTFQRLSGTKKAGAEGIREIGFRLSPRSVETRGKSSKGHPMVRKDQIRGQFQEGMCDKRPPLDVGVGKVSAGPDLLPDGMVPFPLLSAEKKEIQVHRPGSVSVARPLSAQSPFCVRE